MTIVRELLTAIGYDLDEESAKRADQSFDKLFDSATRFADGFNEIMDAVSKGIGIVKGAAEAVLDVPTKMLELAESTAAAGDRFAKTGQQIGLTAEELQKLEFAADRSGVQADQLRDVFKDLSKNLADAGDGAKGPIEAFGKLGIRVRNADGSLKSANQVLLEVADGMQGVSDPARRAQISMAIMGEAGLKMAPLLAGGAAGITALTDRAEELGFVMSNESAAASEAFIDQLTDMRRAALGLSGGLGVQLFPAFGKIIERITKLILRIKPLVEKGFSVLADVVVVVSNALLDGIETVQKYSTFLAVFGAVLGTVAGVITITLIPAIWSYIASLELMTIAQLKAIAIPALIAAGFVLLAATIALVIEDIYQFVTGGESALGNLYQAFLNNPAEGDEHWMMTILRFIVVSIHDAVVAVDDFFRGFFEDAEETGSVVGGLGKVWDTAVQFWMDAIKGFFSWLWGQFEAFSNFSDRVVGQVDKAIVNAFQGVIGRVKGLAGQLSDLPLVGGLFDGEAPALAGARSPAGAPLPSVARAAAGPGASTAVSNSVSRGNTTINVTAPSGSPSDVASAAAEALEDRLERDRRETQRILEANARAVR